MKDYIEKQMRKLKKLQVRISERENFGLFLILFTYFRKKTFSRNKTFSSLTRRMMQRVWENSCWGFIVFRAIDLLSLLISNSNFDYFFFVLIYENINLYSFHFFWESKNSFLRDKYFSWPILYGICQGFREKFFFQQK